MGGGGGGGGGRVLACRFPSSRQPAAPASLSPSYAPHLLQVDGMDYSKLRDLLKEGKWREAEDETRELLIQVRAMGRPTLEGPGGSRGDTGGCRWRAALALRHAPWRRPRTAPACVACPLACVPPSCTSPRLNSSPSPFWACRRRAQRRSSAAGCTSLRSSSSQVGGWGCQTHT